MLMKRLRGLLSKKGKKDKASTPPLPESPDISQIDPPLRLNLEDTPTFYDINTLLPCAVCDRTFAPDSLANHVRICLKTGVKKRKQFDSASQRRQGTDLEQYLPKNFGIPEGSPFTEREKSKSPPSTTRMSQNKTKPHNLQPTHKRLLAVAESSPCPHCGRNFGARALDRHVAFCAEQVRLARAPGGSNNSENVKVARERLLARTSYRAPLGKGKSRSLNREKYSLSRSASEGSGMSDQSFDDGRSTRGSSVEHKFPSINRSPNGSNFSRDNSLPKNHKQSGIDYTYDPFVEAERQLHDLMSSSSNLNKLQPSLGLKRDISSNPSTPKISHHSTPLKSKDDNVLHHNNIGDSNFQRSKSLRSPTKSNYKNDQFKRHNSSLVKPNTYSLNSILQGKKASNEISNKLGKLSIKNDEIIKPKNEYFAHKKQNYLLMNESDRNISTPEKHHIVRLVPMKKKDNNHNEFITNNSMLNDELSVSQESFIDPRIINKDQPLPISVQKFLDNPDLLSSEESLLREKLSKNCSSYAEYIKNKENSQKKTNPHSPKSNIKEPSTPLIDDLSAQYDKIMSNLQQSMTSNISSQDEDALYNELEELMSSMDGESSPLHSVYSFKMGSPSNNISKNSLDGLSVKQNKGGLSDKNNERSKQKIPYNKSLSLTVDPRKNKPELIIPTYSRSQSLFDSHANKNLTNKNTEENSNNSQLEEDIMQSLKDINKLCDNLSDSDENGGFLSLKKREKYFVQNNYYSQDADISQYLPKNLGLSSESPFLEIDESVSHKNHINNLKTQDISNKFLAAAKNVCCPNCGHNFDIQRWIAKQIQKQQTETHNKDIESQLPLRSSSNQSENHILLRNRDFHPSSIQNRNANIINIK